MYAYTLVYTLTHTLAYTHAYTRAYTHAYRRAYTLTPTQATADLCAPTCISLAVDVVTLSSVDGCCCPAVAVAVAVTAAVARLSLTPLTACRCTMALSWPRKAPSCFVSYCNRDDKLGCCKGMRKDMNMVLNVKHPLSDAYTYYR